MASATGSALAFDAAAASYDRDFGANPAGRFFRYLFQERLLRVFPPGARLLDLGSGTGEDAVLLAGRGRSVVGLDAAPAMVERARARAEALGVAGVRFEVRPVEELAGLEGQPFSGAYSNFGALNCADLRATGRGLARALAAGAPLVLGVMGPWPLPATLHRLLSGRGEPRGARAPRVAGVAVGAAYPSPSQVRRAFGPEFRWSGGFGLGVLVPGPEHAGWVSRHPQAFGLLAIAESLVRTWPLLRALGDHNVLLGERR